MNEYAFNSCRIYIRKIGEDRTARLWCISESARKLVDTQIAWPRPISVSASWLGNKVCVSIQIPARVAVAGLVPHLAQLQTIAFLSLLEKEFEEMWPRVSSLLFRASRGKILSFPIPYMRMTFFIQWVWTSVPQALLSSSITAVSQRHPLEPNGTIGIRQIITHTTLHIL